MDNQIKKASERYFNLTGKTAKSEKNIHRIFEDKNVDAIIMATPDHWHAKKVIDAAKAGKHVYVEKGLTRTFDEAVDIYDVVKETGITFQLGHQNRQVEANEKAKQIYRQGLLGPVNLVEIATNRNSPWGAWVWNIHPKGNAKTIDWETFQEPSPNKIPFFFNTLISSLKPFLSSKTCSITL